MTPVRALSGGVVEPLAAGAFVPQTKTVSILDEPTNDLDVETLELLEKKTDRQLPGHGIAG